MFRPVALLALLLPAQALAVETMRIAMGDAAAEVQLSGKALAFGADAEDGLFTAVASGRATVRRVNGRLTLNGAPVVGEALRFRAGAASRDAGIPGEESIKVAEREVRGDVVVRLNRGALQLVDVLPLEDYLVGVLGSEMPRTFPDEALKAQAVAARTYALHKKLQAYGQPFHLGSSVLSQVYGGLAAEDPRTRAAVEATRGLVLTHELAPIEAYFHASCGGRTESGLEALGRDLPYLAPVDCPCGKLPVSRWSLTVSAAELQQASRGSLSDARLQVLGRSPTGRARRVRIFDRVLDAVSFRERLGYTKVKSLSFEVEKASKGAFILRGRGFGHGAGLCQWGAKALADQGLGYPAILLHYYPGTELQALY
ncbi:MAG: SpoIID/LytB domain-containing protein [Myxococcaceae bacterium]